MTTAPVMRPSLRDAESLARPSARSGRTAKPLGTLGHDHSPLAQVRRARGARTRTPGSRASAEVVADLSPTDRAELTTLLAEPYDCMHSGAFDAPDAHRSIFDDVPPIPEPDISWYRPLLERAGRSVDKALRLGGPSKPSLLNNAQEKAIFLQFNYCRRQVQLALEEVRQGDDSIRLAKRALDWHRRAETLRKKIVNCNLGLVLAMAKRMRLSDIDFGDLVSEGNMALLRAVDKFRVDRGFKFSTYACRSILKAYSRIGLKLQRHKNRFPVEFDPRLERSNHIETLRQTHETDCVHALRDILRDNRARLTQIEQEILNHRFHVAAPDQSRPAIQAPIKSDPSLPTQGSETESVAPSSLTLEQVGKLVGLTKERVRQIQNRALEKLKAQLDSEVLL